MCKLIKYSALANVVKFGPNPNLTTKDNILFIIFS